MKKTILKKYANLIAVKGANIKKGQEVMIYCDLDQPEFVEMLVRECYKAGASKVSVEWSYQSLSKLHYRYQRLKTLSTMEKWKQEKWQHQVDKLPCKIYLLSEDPDGLKGVDQKKMAISQQRLYPIIKPYRDKMENRYQWCIVAVPGVAWAKKVFPHLPKSRAVEALWQAILSTSRVIKINGADATTTDGKTTKTSQGDEAFKGVAPSENISLLDPIAEWDAHNIDLKARCKYLNDLHIKSLHYTSKKGTDLTVGMIRQAQFSGGAETTLSGNVFNPNIPSEECFISPMRGEAEGRVYSTKPLSYEGQLIEDFYIDFKGGKAVKWKAKKGEELLTKLINMDEGSAYLGECALVPYTSPIRESGILFYNTLFDENAACHLALGTGFPDTIKDFEKYTLEECRAMGVNESMVHEDFMIGDETLDIVATTWDGETVQIFKDGEWAF